MNFLKTELEDFDFNRIRLCFPAVLRMMIKNILLDKNSFSQRIA